MKVGLLPYTDIIVLSPESILILYVSSSLSCFWLSAVYNICIGNSFLIHFLLKLFVSCTIPIDDILGCCYGLCVVSAIILMCG